MDSTSADPSIAGNGLRVAILLTLLSIAPTFLLVAGKTDAFRVVAVVALILCGAALFAARLLPRQVARLFRGSSHKDRNALILILILPCIAFSASVHSGYDPGIVTNPVIVLAVALRLMLLRKLERDPDGISEPEESDGPHY